MSRAIAILATVALLASACSGDDSGDAGSLDGGPDRAENDGSGDGNGNDSTGDGARDGEGMGDGTADGDGTGDGTGDGGGMSADAGAGDQLSTPDNPTGIIDDGWTVPDELKLCGDRACQCADGEDNDGDGTADGFDTECTGPNDDDEGTFATGISGDNMDPKWQDCFFDGNSGAGDDGCRYHTDCYTGAKTQDDPDCQLTQACIDFCAPRTPNGCDCFGCCDIRDGDVTRTVVVTPDCNEDNLDDCIQCTKSDSECNNTCGDCELCPGKTIDELPDECFTMPPDNPPGAGTGGMGGSGGTPGGGGTGGTPSDPPGDGTPVWCEGGEPSCVHSADCPSGRYCSFGCCLLIPPQ